MQIKIKKCCDTCDFHDNCLFETYHVAYCTRYTHTRPFTPSYDSIPIDDIQGKVRYKK